MFAPGVPELMQEFHSTNIELGTLVVSIYVMGFAFGPMVLAPMSELYGRMPIVSG
jgi:MFS family permease